MTGPIVAYACGTYRHYRKSEVPPEICPCEGCDATRSSSRRGRNR
jgi:hypothetical protein